MNDSTAVIQKLDSLIQITQNIEFNARMRGLVTIILLLGILILIKTNKK
jgi:hypothetical protein